MSILERIRRDKQLLYLSLATALRGIRDNLRYIIWQPFAISLGIPIRDIGALESLMDFAKIIIQPALGAASDVYGRKKFLIARELTVLAAGICFLFAESWQLLAAGMVFIGFGIALIPIWNSTIAESVKANEMGETFSILGSAYMTTGLIGTLAAGWLAENMGYRVVYAISVGFAVLSLIVTVFKIEETHKSTEKKTFTIKEALTSLLDTFRPPRYMWGYYISMSVDLFAFSVGWRLINGLLAEVYGFTPSMLGLMNAANTGTMALFQVVIGRHVDKYGYKKFLTISQAISSVLLAMILFFPSYYVAIAANVLMGFSAAFWGPAEQAWIAKNVDPDQRAKSIGGYSTFRGLVALPGPFIGGIIYDRFGYHGPLTVNLVLAIIDTGLLWFLVKDNAREESGLLDDPELKD
jgi:MFS family permease